MLVLKGLEMFAMGSNYLITAFSQKTDIHTIKWIVAFRRKEVTK